ncbi:DUF2484 family protein [Actibacterium sp. 188UL27-1]|uniref:DUF2484 family protein n=1 Tax=Actibacterium sp. 188UL27-1 TaxID=2786961 RepID=UPI00351C8863
MIWLAWACIGWVLAGATVAMLPMRYQYGPGLALLLVAPILIGLIGWQVGIWAAAAALLAFLSMFRNPLRYLWARLRGQNPKPPR